jgi:hypothetical protein
MADQYISRRQSANKARTRWGVLLLAAVTGCAGRAPQPVAVVQPQDRYVDCAAIFAEVQANNAKISDLSSEQGGKVAQNVAAGVVGLFIWPVWFGMDFQGAAGKEVDALNSRQQYLATLAEQRNCGAPAAPPVAVTQLVAPALAQPVAKQVMTTVTPAPAATPPQPVAPAAPPPSLPPVAAAPPSTNTASPAPVLSNPTAVPSSESYDYEKARRQYDQAEQVYQSRLRASAGDKQP